MMEKHLLLTISEKRSALYGARFLGNFFSEKKEMKITLFYTATKPPAVWDGERTRDSERQIKHKVKEIETKGRGALEDAKKELVRFGFKQDKIGTKFQVRQLSKVNDIIREAEKGLYDAVVLGRRGLSWLEEAYDESVTKEISKKRWNIPLWVCRRPDLKRKNVLVCVDGSGAAYRVVDHVGFILGQEEKHAVTLFMVGKHRARDKEQTEKILNKSTELLLKNGLPAELISTKIVAGANVAKTILKEADQGNFAAVATGRTDKKQSFLDKLFRGSVIGTLLRELEESALWTYE